MIFTLMIISLAGVNCKVKLGDLVPICDLNDPKLNDCATKSTQKLLPQLKDGIKDLHLYPVDPLDVESLDFGQDTGPVSLSWKFTNAKIYGTSKVIVKKIQLNKEDYSFVGDFIYPRFELSGDYIGKGKILLLPIEGKGFGNITTTDMNVHMEFNCSRIVKKKAEHLNIDKMKLSFNFEKSYISLSNLFGGHKELGEATNKFINENSATITNELRGNLENVFADLNKQLMNTVFHNVPMSDAFINY